MPSNVRKHIKIHINEKQNFSLIEGITIWYCSFQFICGNRLGLKGRRWYEIPNGKYWLKELKQERTAKKKTYLKRNTVSEEIQNVAATTLDGMLVVLGREVTDLISAERLN
ncbi:uncharacterized protein LOC107883258 isoform X2 [Acyrthosiphon pisum]|uniref:Uncharacterized protein n=1 Tax=Acyrthosiphon pisum TaxID=7029 RepID=A0A8R2JTL6_ACYPI|nr:uncharacterized protein LOC107883258 isoform X2 [Acyrthosiphon pisum]